MASSLVLRRLGSSIRIPKPLRAARPAIPASRSVSRPFGTNAARDFDNDDDDSSEFAPYFSDAFDPFSPPCNFGQIRNVMNPSMDCPNAAASRGARAGLRRGWDTKVTEDGIQLRMEIPGLGKENVKVYVEQNTLILKVEGENAPGGEESGLRFTGTTNLPDKVFKLDQIKAEMKNGVLKVLLPKVEDEERTDVFHVQVD